MMICRFMLIWGVVRLVFCVVFMVLNMFLIKVVSLGVWKCLIGLVMCSRWLLFILRMFWIMFGFLLVFLIV